ncbi:MAG: hypothetical protein ACUVXJ_08510, partial [Phycisphaerae bacterium]
SVPPKPDGPPAGTKVQLEDQGGSLLVRFPPLGFNFGLLFLIVFAIAWWSFLTFFIGFGARTLLQDEHEKQPAVEAKSPLKAEPKAAEKVSGKDADSTGSGSELPGWGGILLCLFMLPFFAAGFAMILGILWPLFGRTRVRLAIDGCDYRASLLGIGRTHAASVADTYVRWMAEPVPSGRRWHGRSGMMDMSGATSEPHILLSLGTWETSVGGHLGLREQEWVFHEMYAWLKRYAEPDRRSRRR